MTRKVFTRSSTRRSLTAAIAGTAVFMTLAYTTLGEATGSDVPASVVAARIDGAWEVVCARDTWPNITPGCADGASAQPSAKRQISLTHPADDPLVAKLR